MIKNKILALGFAVLLPAFAAALPRVVSFVVNQDNILVYCPPSDPAGCETILAAVGGGSKAYDGSNGTVDLRGDLSSYTALVIPSLADGDAAQPYAFLRDQAVAANLRQSVHGRRVFWSGAPDLGTENRTAKDALIARLASNASSNHGNVGAPGLVVLLDRSPSNRYGWVNGITGINLIADPAIRTYSSVRTVTATGAAIVSGASYTNMASFGFYLPTGAAGVSLDAIGQTLTSIGGQIVLMTHPGANEHEAVVSTDKDDYPPGHVVTITGSGYLAGEEVSLVLVEDPELHESQTFMVTTDSTGSFVHADFIPDEHDVDVRFILQATGQTSGRRSETTFTDAIAVGGAGMGFTNTLGNAVVIDVPTAAAGDLQVAVIVVAKFAPSQVICPPSGWSLIRRTTSGGSEADVVQATYQRVTSTAVAGGTTASFLLRNSNCGGGLPIERGVGGIVTFSGVDATTPVEAHGGATGSSGSDVLAPSVTASANSRIVRTVGLFKNILVGPSSNQIFNVSASDGAERTASAWSTEQVAAGSTGTFKAEPSQSAVWVAQTIVLKLGAPTQAATSTAIVSSTGSTSTYGQPVTFTATVSGSVVSSGTVEFRSGSTTCADGTVVQAAQTVNGSGQVTYTPASPLSVGSHSLRACYSGSTNFLASNGTLAHSVNKATGSIALSNLTHTYDGTAKSATATTTPSGLTVSITYDGSGTSPTNADSYDVVATINDANYEGTQTGTLTISPALVTATAGSGSADYDGTSKSPSACVLSGPYLVGLSCENDPDAVGPAVGTTTINPDVSGGGSNFSITPVAGSFTINKAQAEATATDGGGTFNGTAFTADGTCSNGLTPVIAYSGVSAPVNAGTTTFTVTCGDGGNNYIDDVDEGEIVIAQAAVTATAGSGSAGFDGTTKSPSECVVSGAYTGDLVCTNSPASVGPGVGTTTINPDVDGTGLGNFAITPVVGSFTINQAQADATATDGGGTFNGSAFTANGTCSNDLTPVIVYSGGSAPVNAGTTTFTVTCGDGGNNYIDDVDEGEIEITPALVTATAGSGSATYDGSAKSPSACSVTGAYTGDLACTNNPSSVGPNVGTTTINPSVTGTGIGSNFTVTPAAGSYTINPAQATANAINGGGTFNGSAFTGSGTCSHGLTAVIVYSGGSAPVNAGSTTFTVTCGDGGNNYIDGVDEGSIDIDKADATIDVDGYSGTYDAAAHGATGSATGVTSEDLSSLLDLGASFTNAPGGTASWSFAGNGNYNPASGSVSITIAPKGVTASITAADKIYNGSNAATITSCTVNGTLGSDDVDCGGGSATFDNANAGTGKAVSATGLALSGAQAGNYDLDPTTAATTASITPKDVTVSITASNKVYDGTTGATIATCTVNGRVGSDDVTCSGDAAFADANAGVNKNVSSTNMALAGSADDNYNLTSSNASTTASITPAPVVVSISADAAARQYTDNLGVTVSVAAVNNAINSQVAGSLTGVASGTNGTQTFVTGSAPSATNIANVTLLPGSYTLTGTFVTSNPNFQSGTPATQPLTVNPEDATPKYTGDTWIQSTSTGQATITLSAIVYDDSDGMTGSVANARVTFVDVLNGNSPLGTCKDVKVNITDANLPTQGKATCAWTITLGKTETSRQVTVGFAIAGSHKNKDAVATKTAIVTVTRNAPYTMTGGAAVAGGAPTSMWPGTVGGAEFGLSMSYTSKLTNPQGSVWVKFNVGGVNYVAKSNSLLNFSVFPGATPTSPSTSTFSAKANIVNLETGLSVDGNSIIQLSVVDGKGLNGAGDLIAITVNGKTGGVVYSNKWDRGTAKTLQEALIAGSGNIAINGR